MGSKLCESCVVMVDERRMKERIEKYTGVCVDSLHSFWKELGVLFEAGPDG